MYPYSPAASAYLIPQPVTTPARAPGVPAWGPPADSPWYANLVQPRGPQANLITLSSSTDVSGSSVSSSASVVTDSAPEGGLTACPVISQS
jgi:hypothetical protein